MPLAVSIKDDAPLQSDYLFVYGTLRGDYEPSADESNVHRHYLRGADFVSRAKIRGQLHLVDYYPGLVLSDVDAWVLGEIYVLESNAHLHELDVYEGCAKNSPQPHKYRRQLLAVILTGGEAIEAWVYVYQLNVDGMRLINSGDFLQKQS